jgi:hypothetical protein
MAPGLPAVQRWYIRLRGYPALGLRVRAKSILPLLRDVAAPRDVLDTGYGKGVFTFRPPGCLTVGLQPARPLRGDENACGDARVLHKLLGVNEKSR